MNQITSKPKLFKLISYIAELTNRYGLDTFKSVLHSTDQNNSKAGESLSQQINQVLKWY